MPAPQMSLVIYGPEAGAVAAQAVELAKHFGLRKIFHGWRLSDALPVLDVLAFTDEIPDEHLGYRALPFDAAVLAMATGPGVQP